MIRFIFACAFYTVVAKWGYQEIKLFAPNAAPVVKSVFQKIELPTHDQWSKENVESAVDTAKGIFEETASIAGEIKDYFDERNSRTRG